MKKIILGILILIFVGIYFSFNQTLPVSYGNLVLKGYYDGITTDEELELYDNNFFKYTDGWTNWNGKYKRNKDSIILDYYFPSNRPTIYLIEKHMINSYKIEGAKKILIHDLIINEKFNSINHPDK
jgi:hypothetical protein